MPEKTNERLEQEAREALVAADLSAKMKQWRNPSPPPVGGNRGSPGFIIMLLLLAFGGAAWWLWPKSEEAKTPEPREQPSELPDPAPAQQPTTPTPPQREPIAEKPAPANTRYLALAQTNYRAPDFASDIRGDASTAQDMLNDARRALAERRYAEALRALQNVSAEYQSDAAYLRGHALFGLKRYTQAAAVFGQLTESVRYGEAAQWFEVLALLPDMERKKPLIMSRLKKISDDEGHTFQREAKRLVGKLVG